MAEDVTSPLYTAAGMVITGLLSSLGTLFATRSKSADSLMKMLMQERSDRESDNRALRNEMNELRKLYDLSEAEKHKIAKEFETFRDEQQTIRHDLKAQIRVLSTAKADLEERVGHLEANQP
jgi:uncharacterized protein (DUF3084 family)